jgi:hypothetical protein
VVPHVVVGKRPVLGVPERGVERVGCCLGLPGDPEFAMLAVDPRTLGQSDVVR